MTELLTAKAGGAGGGEARPRPRRSFAPCIMTMIVTALLIMKRQVAGSTVNVEWALAEDSSGVVKDLITIFSGRNGQ
jgi:hypothetical protein